MRLVASESRTQSVVSTRERPDKRVAAAGWRGAVLYPTTRLPAPEKTVLGIRQVSYVVAVT